MTTSALALALLGSAADAAPLVLDAEETLIVEIQGGRMMFLDALELPGRDWNVVLRPYQGNDSQQWLVTGMGGDLVTLMQMSTGRYLDAHDTAELDFRVVTRPRDELDDTQLWRIVDSGDGFVSIQNSANDLFLEAYLDLAHRFQVVLRDGRADANAQTFRITEL